MSKFNSKEYWETRYTKGGNSGAGSYGRLAVYKADFVNQFVKRNRIRRVVEFGSGDGSQLELASYPSYLGLDVSQTSIKLCLDKFSKDSSKSFVYYTPELFNDSARFVVGDLSMSLDVIFHLIETKVYEKYLKDLFNASDKYVIIYASNKNSKETVAHVRHRKFTDYVANHFPEWKMVKYEKNPYPYDGGDGIDTSFSDFYIYKKGRAYFK